LIDTSNLTSNIAFPEYIIKRLGVEIRVENHSNKSKCIQDEIKSALISGNVSYY